MDEEQVKYMVSRFLWWRLPADFSPDAGIHFEQTYRGVNGRVNHEPIGTNLFTATQAEQMIRHMLEGLPEARRG